MNWHLLGTRSTTLTRKCDVTDSLKIILKKNTTESKTGSEIIFTPTASHYCCLDNRIYFRTWAHCSRNSLPAFCCSTSQVLYSERLCPVFSSVGLTVLVPFYGAVCSRHLAQWPYMSQAAETPPGILSTQSSGCTQSRDSGCTSCSTSSLPSWTLLLNFCPIPLTWIVSLPSVFVLMQYSDYALGFILKNLSLASPCLVIYNWGFLWPKSDPPPQLHSCLERSLEIMFSKVCRGTFSCLQLLSSSAC